jgi:2-polyprenyl-3-methyl-5-hydroxy-6-metoxy-1,4-benzoquinol methylase
MEHIKCNLCGHDDTRLLFKRKDLLFSNFNHKFNVVQCEQCSLVYVNPRPAEKEIHNYYTDTFYDVNISKDELLSKNNKQLAAKYDIIKDLSPGKLLDIGCGKGDFLFFMQQKGWKVQGIDFSSTPPNLFDLDIHYGDLSKADYQSNSFDLITLWAVLEHVYDPKSLLLEINRILRPGGTMVALATNIKSIPGRFMRHDDIPRHTTLFTKKTISRLLTMTGFKPIKYYFNQNIFSGSVRGILNYAVKLLYGESIEDIIVQNRKPDRWNEFAQQVKGKESSLMKKIDKLDIKLSPVMDNLLDKLQLGFIMTVRAEKP